MNDKEKIDRRENMFDWLAQVFLVFGIAMMCMVVFCVLFGDSAMGYSTMFELGKSGLSIATMVQFFLLIVIIITLKFIFFTDAVLKKMSLAVRTVLMFAFAITAIVAFVIMFGWFPADQWQAWVMFAVCFGVSAVISTFISVLREKAETQKMQQALERIKERQ